MAPKIRYKYCCVPSCRSTTLKTPEKMFIPVPMVETEKRKWFAACSREGTASVSSNFYCCSDHFNLETDFKNLMEHRMAGRRIILNKGVLPSRFDCQSDRKLSYATKRDVSRYHVRRTQSEVIEADLKNYDNVPSSSVPKEEKIDNIPLEPTVVIKEEPVDYYPTPSTSTSTDPTANEEFILPHEDNSWTTPSAVVEPHVSLSVASLGSPSRSNANDNEPAKKKLKTSDSKVASHVSTTNGPTTSSDGSEHNFGDFSNPGFSRSKDQFDVFGEYIAAKLRSLDRVSCSFTQKAIADLIFEAEMGKYLNQADSAKS